MNTEEILKPEEVHESAETAAETAESTAEPEVVDVETAQPEAATTVGSEELARLVAEAEQRGYVRGRTEALNERLSGPDMFQEPECKNPVTILAGIRESVWN